MRSVSHEISFFCNSAKTRLEAVVRHFAQMPVREADVALEFHNFARSVRGKRSLAAADTIVENGAGR